MKIRFLFLLIAISALAGSCSYSQDCVEGINKLPMYGRVKKCPGQIEADQIFLATCDKEFKTRKEAAAHSIIRGWQYFHAGKLDTAMMRFNQAYLLDSLNDEIYWGFADLLGTQKKFKESLPFFERSVRLNSNNPKIWPDMAVSYGNIFLETHDKKFLDSSIYATKKAIAFDPNNANLYGQLTASYSYFMQKDSARKYLKITDKLDPSAVNPEVRKLLSGNN